MCCILEAIRPTRVAEGCKEKDVSAAFFFLSFFNIYLIYLFRLQPVLVAAHGVFSCGPLA